MNLKPNSINRANPPQSSPKASANFCLLLVKSKWLWKGGLKGGKPAQRVSPFYGFFAFFFYIKKEQIKTRKVGVWKWVFIEIKKIN